MKIYLKHLPQQIKHDHWLQLAITLLLLISHVTLAQQAPRIVTAGGSITEVVYALGQGEHIVATDSTSMFPSEARQLPKIGYFRQIGTESVLSFQPTLLLGAPATGPQGMLEQLDAVGIQIHILGENKSLEGLQSLITDIGELLQAKQKSAELIDQINAEVSNIKTRATQLLVKPVTALFVLSNSDRGLTVAGTNTVPQALFDELGIRNAASALEGYKIMDNEAIVAANPSIVFLANHRFPSDADHHVICAHPALLSTDVSQTCNVHTLDSSKSLGLSPRFPEAMAEILELSVSSNLVTSVPSL